MSRFGLIGPSYASQSPNLDAEACINLYVESDDGGAGNAPLAMFSTPGTKIFATLLSGGNFGAGGTFDKAATAHAVSATAAASATPATIGELALLFTAGNPTQTAGALTPSTGWSLIDSLTTSAQVSNSLNAKILSTAALVSETQAMAASGGWATILAFFGSSTGLVPVIVQKHNIQNGNVPAATYSSNFSVPVSAGNGVMIALAYQLNNAPPTGLSATINGAPMTLIGNVSAGTNGQFAGLVVFWAPNVGGTQTPSFTFTGGNVAGGNIIAYELSGIGQILTVNGPIRGEKFINGRAFVVSGGGFFEVFANGTFTNWGAVANDALPVTMAASPQQLLLASAGTAYVFDLMANTLTAIPGATFAGPVAQAEICDDFFILTIQNSKEFVVSAPLDATDWVTNGSAIVSVFPDNIVSMLVFQRQVWFFSDTQSVVYYDSGNLFPFDVNPNAFIEAGSAAENSPAIFNNSIAWLGSDARGRGKVWLASGYTPTRISNHAVEFAIQSYTRIDDAVGFSYQDQGHEFYCLYFPTPSVTWVYDAMTGMWHQRGFFVEAVGQFRAAHYQNHMFTFGKHLVGDWQSGNVYQLSIPTPNGAGGYNFADDAGNPIRRVRRAPHVSREQKNQFHIELQIYVETGLGPQPPLLDGSGKARDPQLMLSWSDDGGHNFGTEYVLDCGKTGEFKKRARKLQLGRARDRVYQIAMTDPIPWRIVDGYLQVIQGTGI